jgi:hypothetical protein
MNAPNRGIWGPGGQQGGGVNHLQASNGGSSNGTHADAFNHFSDLAHQLLTRTGPDSIIPININVPLGPANLQQQYTVWYILDAAVADEFCRVLAFASVRTTVLPLAPCLLLTLRTARDSTRR